MLIVNKLIWNTAATPDTWINDRISPKGLTPLYKALRESHPSRLLQPLLDAGSDPTLVTKNRRNAFHYAAKSENALELLKMLIAHLDSLPAITNAAKLESVTLRDLEAGKSPQEKCSTKEAKEFLNSYIENLKRPLEP